MKNTSKVNKNNLPPSTSPKGHTIVSIAVLLLTPLAPCMTSATEREVISTVTKLWTYPATRGGDTVFVVATPPAGCDGFWFSASDDETKRIYALLLSAYQGQNTVRIWGDDAQVWPGSGSTYCRVTFAGVI